MQGYRELTGLRDREQGRLFAISGARKLLLFFFDEDAGLVMAKHGVDFQIANAMP